MNYTGHEDHSISLLDAAVMTKRFRDSQAGTGFIIAEYFGRDAISSILSQVDCVGIRLYYALDSENVPNLVITGVNKNGDDLCNGVLAENGLGCPTSCSVANPLNSAWTF